VSDLKAFLHCLNAERSEGSFEIVNFLHRWFFLFFNFKASLFIYMFLTYMDELGEHMPLQSHQKFFIEKKSQVSATDKFSISRSQFMVLKALV